MKVLFTYDYGSEKMEKVRQLGYDIVYHHERAVCNGPEVDDIDVLVCYDPFENLDIRQMKNLKWIQISSIGIDQAPLEYVTQQGIKITNNRGGYSIPMGEWIVLKALEIYKQSHSFYENQKDKKWKINRDVLEIYGKTVGILGTGSIAVEAAKRFSGFGVKVIGLNRDGRDIEHFDCCMPLDRIEEFAGICDVLVLSLPYTKDTHHIVDEALMSNMKDDCALINISRGSIIDEKALVKALEYGKFMGVALDVFEQEPLDEASPLWEMPRVIVTPHNSWMSQMRNERRFDMILENLRRYMEGEKLLNEVDPEKGY